MINYKKGVSVQLAEQIREASGLTPVKVDASHSGFMLPSSRSAEDASRCLTLKRGFLWVQSEIVWSSFLHEMTKVW